MRRYSLVFPMIVALFAGCQSERPEAPVRERDFVGTVVNENTRTSLVKDSDAFSVVWNEGDLVRIQDGSIDAIYKAVTGGSKVTEFKRINGFVPEGTVKAYYPDYIVDGYPLEQVYEPGNTTFNPMMAVSSDDKLNFRNLGSLLKLDVSTPASDVILVDITLTADQSLCGPFTVKSDAAVVSGEKSVRLNCRGVKLDGDATEMFIAIPAGQYTNLVATVNVSGGRKQDFKLGADGSYTFERSKMYQKSLVLDDMKKIVAPAIFPTGKVFNAAIKSLVMASASYDTVDSSLIRKIVFEPDYNGIDGKEIQDAKSQSPIYADYDAGTGTVYVRTPSEKLNLPADVSYMFSDLGALSEISGLDKLNTSECVNMSYMFCQNDADTSLLRSLDLHNFNTAKCTTMRSMFNGLKSLESIDVSSFNTAKVTTFTYMFYHVGMVPEIDCSNFNTANATTLAYMFEYCYNAKKIDVSSFNTSKCTAVNHLFAYCTNLEDMDISHFNTSKCTEIQDLFWHCHNMKTVNVKGLDTSKATDIRSFFNRCDALKSVDVSSFSGMQITSATYCNYFFYNSRSLEEIIAGDNFMFGCNGGSNFFCASTSSNTERPGSVSKGITVICSQKVADWFATTNLRWINSGYSGKTKIPVTFKDYVTGEALTVKWAAN